jgi:hypothetical protein
VLPIWNKIEKIDRRFIFLAVLVAVIIPLIFPMKMNISVSPPVQNIYDFVEKLPEGSVIWMGFDYYNTTRTECDAQAIAFLEHAFRKKHKVFVTSVIPDGNVIADIIVNSIAEKHNREYGKDYVILGYKAGTSIVFMQVCDNIRSIYPVDLYNTPLDDLPMMNNIKNSRDIDLVFTATDNASFDAYVAIANTQYQLPVAGGTTAVSVPLLYVYINSGQALGVLGGLKGAAEYETLIDVPGGATSGMNAQSFVHLFIVIMIVFSNIVFFVNRYWKRSDE